MVDRNASHGRQCHHRASFGDSFSRFTLTHPMTADDGYISSPRPRGKSMLKLYQTAPALAIGAQRRFSSAAGPRQAAAAQTSPSPDAEAASQRSFAGSVPASRCWKRLKIRCFAGSVPKDYSASRVPPVMGHPSPGPHGLQMTDFSCR